MEDYSYLENLPKDVIRTIALELKPIDLISLCATNQKLKSTICEDRGFWYRKLIKDYPEYEKFQKLLDPKKTYIRKFKELITIIEKETGTQERSIIDRYYKAYNEYLKYQYLHDNSIKREIVSKYNLIGTVFNMIILKTLPLRNK